MIYDVAILGSGPGGYVAAIRGGQLGGKVCLIEERDLGGTCLNRGCIPSKAFFESAARMDALRTGAEFGIKATAEEFDLGACVARKNRVVRRLVGGVETLLKGQRVEVVRGRGALASPNAIRVTEPGGAARTIEAKAVIIATGSRPAEVSGIPVDGRRVVTSDEIWDLRELPGRMVIVGGGVIGCEVAHIFAAFGTRVTIVETLDRILAAEEPEASRVVRKNLEERGVEIRTGTRIGNVETGRSELVVTIESGGEIRCDSVVVAAGRTSNTAGLGLEEIGAKLGARGCVEVGDAMETSVQGVYAVGDAAGKLLLAHVATAQARVAVHNCLGLSYRMDYSVIPYAVFTSPEVAAVGAKEKELADSRVRYRVGRFAAAGAGKALCMGQPEGFAKLLSHAETGRILGATVAGAHASDLIGEVTAAMRVEATVADLVGTIHVHPTMSEVLFEAGEDTLGLSIHKPARRQEKRG